MRKNLSWTISILSLLFVFSNCNRKNKSELVWDISLPVIGSQSSPRAADLNNDGVLDIVIGAGKNEYQYSDKGILAFDGKTGGLLWKQEAPDQVFGSATFYDVTADGIKDVFIGGRSPQLKALNGKTGAVIWEYKYQYENDPILKNARFNFNNSVLVPDQNNDGVMELLTVNGGNPKAAPNSEVDRHPGVLMLIDPKNGDIIAADTMPDGKETYMTPVSFKQPGSNDAFIIFGTGGETLNGHLYLARFSDLLNRELSQSKIIASETGHGFIAPPSIADINGDGYYDIIAISHGSNAFAIDGKDLHLIWQRNFKKTECSNSFAVGYFTDDSVPDFFTFVSKGQWPNSTGSVQVLIDGKSGQVAYMDSIGCTGYSSPVVYDLNHDGIDEAIISINEFDCSVGFVGKPPAVMENKLLAIDFKKKSIQTIDQAPGFKNIFSTPYIGDLDNDGFLDIISCQYYHHSDLMLFLGMRLKRIDTPIRIRKNVKWGSYMGSNGDGIFRPE
ncbi:MAG TPA: PQQ-binding-like beta-propeller repeat protein [Cyclobacteriaceae bacterium]|nr:PQQ-binding-like beta-propeller repeat protein [Cyclobacteriaceae bacterium]